MAQVHTHYDNLKVARNAPPEVIRAAYKVLSQKYHPDHNPGNPDAIRIIQAINSAYEVLSDPLQRQTHDQWIARVEAQTTVSPALFSTTATRRKTSSKVNSKMPSRVIAAPPKFIHKTVKMMRLTWGIVSRFSKNFSQKNHWN